VREASEQRENTDQGKEKEVETEGVSEGKRGRDDMRGAILSVAGFMLRSE
jgi:hypothetical protein